MSGVCVCACEVLGCADLRVPDHRMSVERVDDVTVVTCNITSERWHFLCKDGQWFGAPLTNCSSQRKCRLNCLLLSLASSSSSSAAAAAATAVTV